MPYYTVDYAAVTSVTVKVEADDPDAAIDLANDELPADICAQCSGWRQQWSKDEGEFEPTAVYDADDKQVWGEGTPDQTATFPAEQAEF